MNKGQLITYKQHLTVQTNPTTSRVQQYRKQHLVSIRLGRKFPASVYKYLKPHSGEWGFTVFHIV